MSRDLVTLADVYIALVRIREFIADMSKEEFLGDAKTSQQFFIGFLSLERP